MYYSNASDFVLTLPQVQYLKEKSAIAHAEFWKFQFWTKVPDSQGPAGLSGSL